MALGAAFSEIWTLAYPAMLRNLVDCGSDRLTLALVGHYDYSDSSHFDGAGNSPFIAGG